MKSGKNKNMDYVIVLGSEDKEITEKRVRFAESIVGNREKSKYILIFSGTPDEVRWMKESSHLNALIEDKSQTTYDNIIHSMKLIKNKGKIWIVTDKTHLPRTHYLAGRILKNIPFEIIPVHVSPGYFVSRLWYEVTRFIHNAIH